MANTTWRCRLRRETWREGRDKAVARYPARTLLALVLSFTPPSSFAWGSLGHEVAGTIAERFLADDARARVRSLLGDEALGRASTWADRMRDDPAPFWQDEAGPYHYVTVPPGSRYDDVGSPPRGDAVTALAMFRRELCDPATPPARRRLALRFALHVVQDLQQPLHVGNGRDRGGNFDIDVGAGRESFHRVWDSLIARHAGLDRDGFLRALDDAGLVQPPTAADADARRWIRESAALRDRLYPVPRRIDADYLARWLPAAKRRIAQAGTRSAAWLNATFADCPRPLRPGTAR